MSAATGSVFPLFKACPADGVRTEFGVCRGDPIHHIQDLILGDTFLPKRDARWVAVQSADHLHETFTLDIAANVPTQELVTLAELVFMTTTGQRLDVFVTVCCGKLYFVSDTEFRSGVEYVLIDIQRREDAVVPAFIPAQDAVVVPMTVGEPAKATSPNLRLIG
jgi:hypothetical protein